MIKLLIPIVFLVVGCATNPCESNNLLIDQAHESVKANLPHPSISVEFSDERVNPSLDGQEQVISGKVKSQNEEGALILSEFEVRIKCESNTPLVSFGSLQSPSWDYEWGAALDSMLRASEENLHRAAEEADLREANQVEQETPLHGMGSFIGHWSASPADCEEDAGLWIEIDGGQVVISGLEWSARSMKVEQLDDGYTMDVVLTSEGEESTTAIVLAMDGDRLRLDDRFLEYCCGEGKKLLDRCP